jgi:cytoskeletal protein CcmA (bactofilin family)
MDNVKSGDAGKRTLVEEGTQFKGSLSSTCPVVVKGRVEGDVQAPSLQVSSTGAVHGKVKVGEMQSQGELSGEFDADTVQLSGVVKDNTIVRAKSLEVKLTPVNGKMQVVFGECTLDVGDVPAKETVVNPPKKEMEARKEMESKKEQEKVVAKANGASVPPPAEHRNGSSPPPAMMADPGQREGMQAPGAESSEGSDTSRGGRRRG